MGVLSNMDRQRLEELFIKYVHAEASPEECANLYALIRENHDTAYLDELSERFQVPEDFLMELPGEASNQILEAVLASRRTASTPVTVHRVHFLKRYRWIAAALLLLVAGAGSWRWLLSHKSQQKGQPLAQVQRFKNDVAPGKSGAILKLANGTAILLDTSANGKVLGHFTKTDQAITVNTDQLMYASLETPVSRTEQLTLADGSMVWLNAASSIRFPTVFKGKERLVEITGEVYIQVAHNDCMPFKVKVKDQVIEDIGTEFNINAYDNEPAIRTTVVQGSVRVIGGRRQLVLKPGEQSAFDAAGKLALNSNPDMDAALAWKNGIFRYDGETIGNIMKQVSRWYGVEVVYRDTITEEFVAKRIPRDVPVSMLLSYLEETGHVHFMIEGKTITVMK